MFATGVVSLVLIIQPYVSGVRMTEDYLKHMFEAAGVKVKGFLESLPLHGDISKADVAICTIEKANILKEQPGKPEHDWAYHCGRASHDWRQATWISP